MQSLAFGTGAVLDMLVGQRKLAALVKPVAVAESTAQNQSSLNALMRVAGAALPGLIFSSLTRSSSSPMPSDNCRTPG